MGRGGAPSATRATVRAPGSNARTSVPACPGWGPSTAKGSPCSPRTSAAISSSDALTIPLYRTRAGRDAGARAPPSGVGGGREVRVRAGDAVGGGEAERGEERLGL